MTTIIFDLIYDIFLSSCPVVSSPLVLVFSGANVNVGRGGDSPLHAAVRQDSVDQVSVLLDYGADVNLRDSNNQRPVELAPPGGKTQQLLMTFEGTAISSTAVILRIDAWKQSKFKLSCITTVRGNLSVSSFSQESLPAVSYPDQESDWSIQTEAAPRPSSPFPAH